MKTLAARQTEARNRCRTRGVRIRVIEHAHSYSTLSQTEPGVVYTISRTRGGWECECRGYRFTGCCKHLAAVERRSEREGWDFGRIAAVQTQEPTTRPDLSAGLALLMGK